MTNKERQAALQTAFDGYNWSMRVTGSPGAESVKIHVFNAANQRVGVLILNEGRGYYRSPQLGALLSQSKGTVGDLFYKLVDGAIGEPCAG